MRAELVPEAAGSLAWAALTAPLAGGGVVVDPGTETLVAPPAAFRELVEPGSRLETRAALAGAGAVHGGRVPALLRAGVEAVRAPVRRLELSFSGAAGVDVWIAGRAAALTTVQADGRVRLVPLPAAAVAPALVRVMGLAGADGPARGAERRLAPGALATLLAAGGDDALPGVHTHARLADAADAEDAVEIVGFARGWRRVVIAGDGVALVPAAPEALRAAVSSLLAQRS